MASRQAIISSAVAILLAGLEQSRLHLGPDSSPAARATACTPSSGSPLGYEIKRLAVASALTYQALTIDLASAESPERHL